ncbi:hypothetical protein Hanom_Chr00s025935g01765031 [Helianthus anomalus]
MSKSLRHENIWIPSGRHAPSVPPAKFLIRDLYVCVSLFNVADFNFEPDCVRSQRKIPNVSDFYVPFVPISDSRYV